MSAAADVVKLALWNDYYGEPVYDEVAVLARRGALVAHDPLKADGRPHTISVTHELSGLLIAYRQTLADAVALMEALSEFPWHELKVWWNKQGDPIITNRRAHAEWLAKAKAIAHPVADEGATS